MQVSVQELQKEICFATLIIERDQLILRMAEQINKLTTEVNTLKKDEVPQ